MSSSADSKDPDLSFSPNGGTMTKSKRSKAVVPLVLLFTVVFLVLFGLVIGGDYLRRRLLRVEDELAELKASFNRGTGEKQETTRSDEVVNQELIEAANSPQRQSTDLQRLENHGNETSVSAPNIYVSPRSLTVKMGHRATLYCHVTGAWPKADITWNKRDGGLQGIQVVTSETSKLLINRATFSDAGNYVCRAQNAVGAIQEEVEVILEVTVKAFHEASLECPNTGDQSSTQWTREGGTLPEGHSKVDKNKLLIQPVHVEDAGTYVCIVGDLSARIQLTVEENDCTIFDFEHGIDDWKKTGLAFNNQPTYGDNPTARGRGQPSKHEGHYWIGGAEYRPSPEDPPGGVQWDGPHGTATSPPFKIKGHTLKFLIGGGCDISVVRAELLVDGRAVQRATGDCNETMREKSWNVSAFQGKEARLRLIDNSHRGWGHINFDYMREIC